MAQALIIDDSYGRLAHAYYLKFPQEPISATASLPVEKLATIKETSLDSLLSLIQKDAKAGNDLVIVSHGNDDGLTMGLFRGHPKVASTDHLDTLLGNEPRDKKGEKLSLRLDLVDQLVSKVAAVQKIGLGHVAFRGCSIGGKLKHMTTLKSLLRAKIVSATNLLSTFGAVKPEYFDKDKKKFEQLSDQLGASANIHSGNSKALFMTRPGKEAFTELIRLIFDKESGLLEWLQTHVVSGTTPDVAKSVRNNCPVHYLTQTPPILPLDGTHKTHQPVLAYADFIHTSEEKAD
jgi:hypothetical protein